MKQLWFAMSLGQVACYSLLTPRPLPRPGRYTADEPGQSVTELRAVIHQHHKQGVESLRYRHARLDNRPLDNCCKWMARAGKWYSAAMKSLF